MEVNPVCKSKYGLDHIFLQIYDSITENIISIILQSNTIDYTTTIRIVLNNPKTSEMKMVEKINYQNLGDIKEKKTIAQQFQETSTK